jgi:hypothetical protein
MKKLLALLFFTSMLGLYACAWWDTRAYYEKHPWSANDIRHEWGQPLDIEVLEDGTEKWVYFLSDPTIHSEIYFLIRNGRVVDSGTN